MSFYQDYHEAVPMNSGKKSLWNNEFDKNYSPKGLEKNIKHWTGFEEQTTPEKRKLETTDYYALVLDAYIAKAYADCLQLIEDAIKMNPSNASQYSIMKAACFIGMKINTTETYELLNDVLKHDPLNSLAHYGLGSLFYHDGDFLLSIHHFDKALEMNDSPTSTKAHEVRRRALKIIQSTNMALAQNGPTALLSEIKLFSILDEALGITLENDEISSIIMHFRDCYSMIISEKSANEKVEYKDNSLKERISYAENLINQNNLIAANNELQQIFSMPNPCPRAFYVKGLLYYRLSMLKESLMFFEKSIDMDPFFTEAEEMGARAQLLIELFSNYVKLMSEHNYIGAVSILTQMLDVDQANKNAIKMIYYQRAYAFIHCEDIQSAFADCSKICELENSA